jgi:hypothetical protein
LFAAFSIFYYTAAIAVYANIYTSFKHLIKALAQAFGLLAGSLKSSAS